MAKKRDDGDDTFVPPTMDEVSQAMEEQAAPEQGINAMDVLTRLTLALEALTKRQAQAPDDRVGELIEKLSTALVRVSETNIQGSQIIADETRRSHRPENQVPRNVSVFNRRGTLLADHPDPTKRYVKPLLKCPMLIPWLAEWESCTREEVELLNLLEPGEYAVKRIDNSKFLLTINMDYKVDKVTPSRLVATHETAYNNDNFRLIPALPDLLRQVLKQHPPAIRAKAAQVLSDEDEEALIEAGELSVSA